MIFSMHFIVFIFKAPWGDLVGVGFAARMCVCRVDDVLAVRKYTRRSKIYAPFEIILAATSLRAGRAPFPRPASAKILKFGSHF